MFHDLHFHRNTERGTVFHLMGALSEFGKLGMVCIGNNLKQAKFLYKNATKVLHSEAKKLQEEIILNQPK